MGYLIGFSTYNKHDHLKSRLLGFNKVKANNAFISDIEKERGKNILHPINGASDYKMLDMDLLFGNENLKIGANFSIGMLGAAMNAGIYINGWGTAHPEIRTIDLGYFQYGIKAILFNFKDLPVTTSVGLNRLRGFNARGSNDLTKEERRSGFGVDFEVKYYLGDRQFKPYLAFYAEMKRFSKEYRHAGNSVMIEVPALNTQAFGLTLGFIIDDW